MKDRIKLDPILERLRSRRGRPKKEEPLPEGTPLERCLDCLHWHSRGELERKPYMDISSGRCKLTGLPRCSIARCGKTREDCLRSRRKMTRNSGVYRLF